MTIDHDSEFWRLFNDGVRERRKVLRDYMESGQYETITDYREAVGELKGLKHALGIGRKLFGIEPRSPLEKLRELDKV